MFFLLCFLSKLEAEMVTAYTAKLIEDGQSFSDFVWTCAKAFSPFVHMRDVSTDAKVTFPEPETPTTLFLRHAVERARELESLSEKEIEDRARHDFILSMQTYIRCKLIFVKLVDIIFPPKM